MTISCAALMCHAPIVIPAIGGSRAGECARTTAAMREVAARIVAHAPDVVVLISPHTPRDPLRFGVVHEPWLDGDFGRFGVPEVALRMRGAKQAAERLCEVAARRRLHTWHPSGANLDHGALVPLYFLSEAGYAGPTLLIALPYPDGGLEAEMGHAIAETAGELGQRFVVLASGDMSHRLRPNAPAGYDPRAKRFDARFAELIGRGELLEATRLDGDLRELAAEDVVDSCTVAAAAAGFDATGHRVLAYEGPFGVGYLEALLYDRGLPAARAAATDSGDAPPRELLDIARGAIEAHLHGRSYAVPHLPAPHDRTRGVFVTLRTPDGALRGCIGHIEPALPTLAEEVASCAVSSALRDTRFAPVGADELDDLRIELSLLSQCEPVTSLAELDPARYGVVVSDGNRRGVLLPDIEGVDSAVEQVRIAAKKAGIDPNRDFDLERFEVMKLRESDAPQTASRDSGA